MYGMYDCIMAIEAYFSIVLLFATDCPLCLSLDTCSRGTNVFKTEPTDLTAREGDTVDFTCAVDNFNLTTDVITWSLSPEQSHQVVPDYDTEKNLMKSKVLLYNISNTDIYATCSLNRSLLTTSGKYEWNCFLSQEARLSVLYFPKKKGISCHPIESQLLSEGSFLSASCEVARSKPAVDIRWEVNNNIHDEIQLPRPSFSDNGFTRISRIDLPVSAQMHSISLTCIVTSQVVFPEKELTCSVGPVKVMYPPRAFVNSTKLTLRNYDQTQVECLADGYPDNYTYSWSCSTPDLLDGCDGNSKTVDLSINKLYQFPSLGMEYVLVTCSVSNSVGNGTASSNLTVEKPDDIERQYDHMNNTSETCNHEFSNITVYGHYKAKYATYNTNFQCIFSEVRMFKSFKTLINDTDKLTVEYVLEEDLPWSILSLKLLNVSKSNINETIVCYFILSCNYTQYQTIATILPHPTHLFWQNTTILAIIIIVAFFLSTACIVTLIWALWQKYNCLGKILHGSSRTKDVDHQDDYASICDPVYEEPTALGITNVTNFPEPAAMTDQQEVCHIYESNVHYFPAQRFSSSSSPSSEATDIMHMYHAIDTPQMVVSDTPKKVLYDNERVVRMHLDHNMLHSKNAKTFDSVQ